MSESLNEILKIFIASEKNDVLFENYCKSIGIKDYNQITTKEYLMILENILNNQTNHEINSHFKGSPNYDYLPVNSDLVKNEYYKKLSKIFIECFEEISSNIDEESCFVILKDPCFAKYYYCESDYSFNKTIAGNYAGAIYFGFMKYINSISHQFDRSFEYKSSFLPEYMQVLCENYDDNFFEEKHKINKELLIDDIFILVSASGTSNFKGYHSNGIMTMNKYISLLPNDVMEAVLLKYTSEDIINSEITRLQVHTIIKNMKISSSDKKFDGIADSKGAYKFLFLDGVRLINKLHTSIQYSEMNINQTNLEKNHNKRYTGTSFFSIKDLIESKFGWNIIQDSEKLEVGFENNFENGKMKFKIALDVECKKIFLYNHEHPERNCNFDFDYDDWQINNYMSRDFLIKSENFVNGTAYVFKDMIFSLLYLDGANSIKESIINFEKKYDYDIENKKLTNIKKPKRYKNIYGENVKTLTCIVGKNGAGKTSTINFIKDIFFEMFKLINEQKLQIDKGKIINNDLIYDDIIGAYKFCVVFQLGAISYFICNIDVDVSNTEIQPYSPIKQLSYYEYSKIIYFSSMISLNDKDIFKSINTNSERSLTNKKTDKEETSVFWPKKTNEFKVSDYSDKNSFMTFQRYMIDNLVLYNLEPKNNDFFNNELFYKIIFILDMLKNETGENVEQYIDKDLKDLKVTSNLRNHECNIGEIKFNTSDDLAIINSYLNALDCKIEYLSSGQFARLSFLSKLYWILKGFNKHKNMIEQSFKNKFDIEHILQKNQSAIIFIDEGELYYHPEWQRTYISTLLDFINNYGENINIQIVVSTNSPFMISDVLSDDVVYLPAKGDDVRTFGQNIHTLLKDNFFMEFTIGQRSREFIDELIQAINNIDLEYNKNKDEIEFDKTLGLRTLQKYYDLNNVKQLCDLSGLDVYKYFDDLINIIGEDIYKNMLTKLLDDSLVGRLKNKEDKKEIIALKIKRLNEELSQLGGNQHDIFK